VTIKAKTEWKAFEESAIKNLSACDSEAISAAPTEKDKQMMIIANIESIIRDKVAIKTGKKELTKRLNDNEAVALPDPSVNPTKRVKTKSADGSVSGEKLPGYNRNGSPFSDIIMYLKGRKETEAPTENADELKDKMMQWYSRDAFTQLVNAYYGQEFDDKDLARYNSGKVMDVFRQIPFKILLSIYLEPGKVANKENFKNDCSQFRDEYDKPAIPFQIILVLYELFGVIKKIIESDRASEAGTSSLELMTPSSRSSVSADSQSAKK